MDEDFEEIVRDWYNRLRPVFLVRLANKFPLLTLGDAENIYQDVFIAIYDNILAGRVDQDTSWESYIMKIGTNLANKEMRRKGITYHFSTCDDDSDDSSNIILRKVEEFLNSLPNDENSLSGNPEVNSILGNELTHTPDPCAKIVRYFYYEGMSMEEIAETMGYKNAMTAKTKKSRCMTDLIKRVTEALNRVGIDVKPKQRNRNGKN